MNLSLFFWLLIAFLTFVIVPIAMLLSMRDHLRGKGSDRRGGSATAGIGAGMQELDRLIARPSVEFLQEAETPVLKREDDAGGE